MLTLPQSCATGQRCKHSCRFPCAGLRTRSARAMLGTSLGHQTSRRHRDAGRALARCARLGSGRGIVCYDAAGDRERVRSVRIATRYPSTKGHVCLTPSAGPTAAAILAVVLISLDQASPLPRPRLGRLAAKWALQTLLNLLQADALTRLPLRLSTVHGARSEPLRWWRNVFQLLSFC